MRTRREFPSPVKREAYRRSGGICECHRIPHVFAEPCGRPLGQGNTFYEHVDCDGIGGPPILDNCACLTKTCWKYKTDHFDKPIVADTRRLADRARNIKTVSGRRLPGRRDDPFKMPIGGRHPIDRHTGQPWRGR
jgi:hypothetical protein